MGQSFSRKRILNNISVELYRSIAARLKTTLCFQTRKKDGSELKKGCKIRFQLHHKAFDYVLGILKNDFSMKNNQAAPSQLSIIVACAYLGKNKTTLTPNRKGKLTLNADCFPVWRKPECLWEGNEYKNGRRLGNCL